MSQSTKDMIVIGAGLTGLTTAYYLRKAGCKVRVLESQNKVGGVIQTQSQNGFTFETGPNTGVIGNVETVSLLQELENEVAVDVANPNAKFRWILKNKKWKPLPYSVWSAVTTPLFTWYDKFRILGEPFRHKGTDPDETLANLVRRRMGNSFLDYAIDPFISGIYAGDPEKLIPRLALPKLYNLEQSYGSFIKGAMAKAKEPKTELEKKVSKDIFSIKGGLHQLMEVMADKIGRENLSLQVSQIEVTQNGNAYSVSFTDADGNRQTLHAEKVISTISAQHFDNIFPFVAESDRAVLQSLKYAKVILTVVGYNQWKGIDLNAFGGLIPSKEQVDLLGILFPSSIFAHRAPQGGALLSVFIGGIKKEHLFDKTDEQIKELALAEIKKLLGQEAAPDVLEIFRYPTAIPQYIAGTQERFDTIKKIQAQFPGLYLAGNIRDGIGIADRIKQGHDLAVSLSHPQTV